MIELTFGNAVGYYAQVLLLVLASAAAARLLPLPTPRSRFVYWRGVVAASLLLPVLALLQAAPALAPAAFTTTSEAMNAVDGFAAATAQEGTLLVPALFWMLALGIVLRALWLMAGLVRLRRLRNHSNPVTVAEEIEVLRRGLAFRAALRTHPTVRQPITFGFRQPIVVLPHAFERLPLETQRAVACHELLHVQRRDWLWTLGEELVRTLFWFHPAMRWALTQVQLGREEVVDARTVELTGSPRAYLNALLTFAGQPALAPATLFARRHHLGTRIRRMAEEVHVSGFRLGATCAVLASVLAASSWGIAATLPLTVDTAAATQQTSVSSNNVRVSLVGPNLPTPVTQVTPEYPADLLRAGVGATITLTVTVNASGRVADVRDPKWQMTVTERSAVNDVPALWARKPWTAFVEAARSALSQWTFESAANDSVFPVTAVFGPGMEVMTFAPAPPPPPPPPPPQAAERLDQGSILPAPGSRSPGQVPQAAAPPPPPPPPPLRVGGSIRAPLKIKDVRPIYPEQAKAEGVSGVVILEVHIGSDGSVMHAAVVRSIPPLNQSAIEAVKQWRFEPTLLNGSPVDVLMMVTVNFTLA